MWPQGFPPEIHAGHSTTNISKLCTAEQRSSCKPYQRVQAAYYQSDAAASQLPTQYQHNGKSLPLIRLITKKLRQEEKRTEKTCPKEGSRDDPLHLLNKHGRSAEQTTFMKINPRKNIIRSEEIKKKKRTTNQMKAMKCYIFVKC